jgi:hypothetical protein
LIAAFLTSLIRYRQLRPKLLRLFLPFLMLSLIAEGIGAHLRVKNIDNHCFYNFFTCFEFLFYSYIYLRLIEQPWKKNTIRYSLVLYPLLFLANMLFKGGEGFTHFHTITYRVGSVMVVTWCCFYFGELMRSPGYVSVLRDPFFWVSTGLLFFYTGFFFYMSAGYILLYIKLDDFIFDVISETLNVILYGCFLIAFVCEGSVKKRS